MRLNKFLAACGLGSRRATEALINEGKVKVNGVQVTALATFVVPGRDTVVVDGKPIRPPRHHTHYVLHKPEGVVTTAKDPEGRPTVMTLVPKTPRVFPVGRLDVDTTGLLLLTDDGNLAHQVLHPRYRMDKEYSVLVMGTVEEPALKTLREGLLLENESRPTAPAEVMILERRPRRTRLGIILHEGRKRQIRRMLEAVGHPVVQLKRVRVGPLTLKALTPGEYRTLSQSELAALERHIRKKRSKGQEQEK